MSSPSRSHLRLWLRLLATTNEMERALRRRLRAEFGTTLPRFDVMAALERAPEGLSMSELSRHLMVTNGNTTVLVGALEHEGLVRRTVSPSDRRSFTVALTAPAAPRSRGWPTRTRAGSPSCLPASIPSVADELSQGLHDARLAIQASTDSHDRQGARVTDGFRLEVADRVATITLDRPAKKNPLTFELYATLRDWFERSRSEPDIRAIVLTGAGGNFCSGGDVDEIIGPLVGRSTCPSCSSSRA